MGVGVEVLGWVFGVFVRSGCLVDAVWDLLCVVLWVFWGWGSFYKHRGINLEMKMELEPHI